MQRNCSMPKKPKIPKDFLQRISTVKNKRALLVLKTIVEKGFVTTEDLNKAGYGHPPRAARDVRELGFPLITIREKNSKGKSNASYKFDTSKNLQPNKMGRRLLPKKKRDLIIRSANGKCQICGANHNLQVDHRIPYEVAGEPKNEGEEHFQVLCGSCNRKKSWDCEHCENLLNIKDLEKCRTCYWAEPNVYIHVAMRQQRRVDLVWNDQEVADYERIKLEAERNQKSLSEQIKYILENG